MCTFWDWLDFGLSCTEKEIQLSKGVQNYPWSIEVILNTYHLLSCQDENFLPKPACNHIQRCCLDGCHIFSISFALTTLNFLMSVSSLFSVCPSIVNMGDFRLKSLYRKHILGYHHKIWHK